jgi:hypothetical protein
MWKSKFLEGEKCRCGKPAYMKVGEEIFLDDPSGNILVGTEVLTQARHNLTAQICEDHARELFGDIGIDLLEEMR